MRSAFPTPFRLTASKAPALPRLNHPLPHRTVIPSEALLSGAEGPAFVFPPSTQRKKWVPHPRGPHGQVFVRGVDPSFAWVGQHEPQPPSNVSSRAQRFPAEPRDLLLLFSRVGHRSVILSAAQRSRRTCGCFSQSSPITKMGAPSKLRLGGRESEGAGAFRLLNSRASISPAFRPGPRQQSRRRTLRRFTEPIYEIANFRFAGDSTETPESGRFVILMRTGDVII